jgi:acyl-CoA synthetase (AMP-forming)/AMP-acid ligase II
VESALVSFPACAEAAVIGRPDPVKGETIKAFVILRQGHQPSDELLRQMNSMCAKNFRPLLFRRTSSSCLLCPRLAAEKSCVEYSKPRNWVSNPAIFPHSKIDVEKQVQSWLSVLFQLRVEDESHEQVCYQLKFATDKTTTKMLACFVVLALAPTFAAAAGIEAPASAKPGETLSPRSLLPPMRIQLLLIA